MATDLIGSRISLMSKSEVRYVGYLYDVNVEDSTVCLRDVKVRNTKYAIFLL